MTGVLFLFDPEAGGNYLPCPFRSLTGLLCPGCGSQRAAHDLLHLRIGEAWEHNAAFVLALPVLAFHMSLGRVLTRSAGSRDRILAVCVLVVIAWGVVRNIPGVWSPGR